MPSHHRSVARPCGVLRATDSPMLVAGEGVGVIGWSGDRRAEATFVLPETVRARGTSGRDVTVEFVADELWQPPGDPRRIGAGLCSIRFV